MNIMRTFKQTELCYLSNSGDMGSFNNEKRLKIGARLVSRNNYKRGLAHADVKKEAKMGVLKIFKDHRKLDGAVRSAHKRVSKMKYETERDLNEIKKMIAVIDGKLGLITSLKTQMRRSETETNTIERRVLREIKSNKKVAVRNMILENKEQPTTKLLDLLVREKGLCSRASFYRHLSDLKLGGLMQSQTGLRQSETETDIKKKSSKKKK